MGRGGICVPRRFVARPVRSASRRDAIHVSNRSSHPRLPAWFWPVACAILVFVGLIFLIDYRLRPIVINTSSALAQRIGSEALNEALVDAISDYPDAKSLVKSEIERGAGGTSLAVTSLDMAKLAALQGVATRDAQTRLRELSHQHLRLPVLQLLSGSLLSGYALTVPVRFSLMGTVHSNLQTDIESKGVNQVVHVVYLELTANVMVITPLVHVPTTVQTRAPVVYLVMTGPVPNAYYQGSPTVPLR